MKKFIVAISILLALGGCFPTKQEKHQQLIQAIRKGDNKFVQEYIAKEKDINFKTKNGSPVDIAMNQKNKSIAIELLKAGGKSAYVPLPPLSFAIVAASPQGNEANRLIVQKLINQKTIGQRDKQGNTPLYYAVESGDVQLVALLCKRGAIIDAANKEGITPLLHAAQLGKTEMVRILHERGANVNRANEKGETALFKATEGNYVETVQYLLQAGAHVNAKTKVGKTALMTAAEYGYDSLVALLLRSGADVHVQDKTGNTALSLAKYWKHENIVRRLQQKGAR
ncbi:ankyrin repeat domain-containing protein [Anoxybacteroides tepidamans]|uniref:ankyrin repeat domain-containing protein n=1 Tax=Anoxybacteroides tepidamans TaxID=265948 RepID=UPI000485F1F3|nr:ankyrin repeat domain-containing protein [Anoxybacillus tepidamans]